MQTNTVKSDFLVLSSWLFTLFLSSVLLVLHLSQHPIVDLRAASILACVHSNTSVSFKGCFNENEFLFISNINVFFMVNEICVSFCVTRS